MYLNLKVSSKDIAIFGEYEKHKVTERRRKQELKTVQCKWCVKGRTPPPAAKPQDNKF